MTEAHGPVAPPTVRDLAIAFNTLAFESVGGGLAAWSQRMIVEDKRWLTEEEFLSLSTICGILPGANQVNMAVFVGARYRGLAGALAAVAGLIAFPAVAALAAGFVFLEFRDNPHLRHVLTGMSCAAVGLTLSVAFRQGLATLTSAVPLALFAATFVLAGIVRAPLWLTLALLGSAGFAWAWRRQGASPA